MWLLDELHLELAIGRDFCRQYPNLTADSESCRRLTYVQWCCSAYTLARSVFNAFNALCGKPPPSRTQRKATSVLLLLLRFVLIALAIAIAIAIKTQHSLDSSLPVHKTERESMGAARSVLNASWVLLGTDALEYLCSVVARWFE